MDAREEKIREYITKEVFVRGKDEYIFPESNWLMDFRRVCLDPGFLDVYTDMFYERFKDRYPFQVGGMEVAAIPLVSAIVMKMRERGMPVNGFFIRKSRKKTGLLKMVEGKLTDDPVILVDDLINNGYTLDRQLKVLEEAGKKAIVYFTLLRFRSLSAYQKYSKQGMIIEGLFGLDEFTGELGTELLDKKEKVIPKESFQAKWYFKAPDALLEAVVPKSGFAFDEKQVYLGSDRGVVYALSRVDGSVVWQHRIGLGPWGSKRDKEIFSTPVLHAGRLYFGAYDGNIYCVEAETGKRLWVSFEADWIAGSSVIDAASGRLYVPSVFGGQKNQGGVVALDIFSGKATWRTRFPSPLRSTPLLVEQKQRLFVGDESGTVFCMDSETGRILWSFRTGGAVKDAPVYDEHSEAIIFSSFDGSVYKVTIETGLLLWKFDVGLANYSSPCLWQDRVFVCSLDKNLYCLDLQTGKKLWLFPARARIFSSPRAYGGSVYFGANDARMYKIDALTGRQRGYFQTVERITNPVIFDPQTRDFFLQTYANELYYLIQEEG